MYDLVFKTDNYYDKQTRKYLKEIEGTHNGGSGTYSEILKKKKSASTSKLRA